jgi:hypothetical protein
MATVADLPQQYRPYFKAINKGIQRMIDIVFDPTPDTLNRKLQLISEINRHISANITSIEYFVNTGKADAEAEMDAVIAKPLVEV